MCVEVQLATGQRHHAAVVCGGSQGGVSTTVRQGRCICQWHGPRSSPLLDVHSARQGGSACVLRFGWRRLDSDDLT
jgi:hypothetical protein